MRRRLRRAAAFALVPLSMVPLALVAPQLAPSFERGLRHAGLLAADRPLSPPADLTDPIPPERNR